MGTIALTPLYPYPTPPSHFIRTLSTLSSSHRSRCSSSRQASASSPSTTTPPPSQRYSFCPTATRWFRPAWTGPYVRSTSSGGWTGSTREGQQVFTGYAQGWRQNINRRSSYWWEQWSYSLTQVSILFLQLPQVLRLGVSSSLSLHSPCLLLPTLTLPPHTVACLPPPTPSCCPGTATSAPSLLAHSPCPPLLTLFPSHTLSTTQVPQLPHHDVTHSCAVWHIGC